MTPDQQADDLLGRGYTEVQEWGELHVGDRVRHVGQHYAWDDGTATIERIFYHPTSAWAQKYNAPDVEIIVRRDAEMFGDMHGFWANYHTVKVSQ